MIFLDGGYVEALAAARYVNGYNVSLDITHKTQEFRNMNEWLLNFNRTNSNTAPVSIFGFDGMEYYDPSFLSTMILDYILRVDPEYYSDVLIVYSQFSNTIPSEYSSLPLSKQDAIFNDLLSVLKTLDENREKYVSLSSEDEYLYAYEQARLMLFAERALRANRTPYNFSITSEMVYGIVNSDPEAKVVIWTHASFMWAMQWYLEEFYEENLFTIGITTGAGSIREFPDSEIDLPDDIDENSFIEYANQTGLQAFLLITEDIQSSELNEIINQPLEFVVMGNETEFDKTEINLSEWFDTIIYIWTVLPVR
jgi:erythromycin esterase-like protein